jgi:hypothetical protein
MLLSSRTFVPIWIAACFDEEKPRDDKGFVAAFFPTLFLAVEVAVAVATLLDFEGEEDDEALFLLFGAIAPTSNKEAAEQGQETTKETQQARTNNKKQQQDMRRSCWSTTKPLWMEKTKEGWVGSTTKPRWIEKTKEGRVGSTTKPRWIEKTGSEVPKIFFSDTKTCCFHALALDL